MWIGNATGAAPVDAGCGQYDACGAAGRCVNGVAACRCAGQRAFYRIQKKKPPGGLAACRECVGGVN
ncbi:protein of unknown function (plasmid) [Cupriavidus taiwanensis]|uniref:Uncharacterized protein n=1 Tax=Cupriavidus taiwanensis TaxID=164546 RepID=A0A375IQ56_9BURK|nr:protein of unknown function [Cupriavidus taiwanensis]